MSRVPDVSVIVLAFNERDNVGPVLDELFTYLDGQSFTSEVWVVDDGSHDDTAAVAQERLAQRAGGVLAHATNRGMGAGIKTGSRACKGDWVTFLPADGQIPPETLGTLMAARKGVNLVLSTYFNRDDGLARKVLSWGVRTLITAVHGVRVQSDGPYLFRRGILDPSQLEPDTFFLNFEVPIRATAAGLRTAQVEVRCRPRRSGESKTARPGVAMRVVKDLFALRARRTLSALRRLRP